MHGGAPKPQCVRSHQSGRTWVGLLQDVPVDVLWEDFSERRPPIWAHWWLRCCTSGLPERAKQRLPQVGRVRLCRFACCPLQLVLDCSDLQQQRQATPTRRTLQPEQKLHSQSNCLTGLARNALHHGGACRS